MSDSITNKKGLKPWWNSQKKEVSKKLLLHTLGESSVGETNCQDSHSNFSNGTFQNIESNSWYSVKKWVPTDKSNYAKISSLSSHGIAVSKCFQVNSIEKENKNPERTRVSSKAKTKEMPVNSSRKIRLYPNKEQENHLRNMFGCYRKTWNLALNGIKNDGLKINAIELRNKFVTKENLPSELQYLCSVNNHVRESAIFELVNAYKIGFNKQKVDEKFKFDIKYKSKKLDKSIVIPKSAVSWKDNRLSLCPKLLKSSIKCFNSMNKRFKKQKVAIKHECRLVIDEIGRFYLHIPISVDEDITENQGDKTCAIDPGVRTPYTLYSPDGNGIKFGDGDFKRTI